MFFRAEFEYFSQALRGASAVPAPCGARSCATVKAHQKLHPLLGHGRDGHQPLSWSSIARGFPLKPWHLCLQIALKERPHLQRPLGARKLCHDVRRSSSCTKIVLSEGAWIGGAPWWLLLVGPGNWILPSPSLEGPECQRGQCLVCACHFQRVGAKARRSQPQGGSFQEWFKQLAFP